MKKPNNRIHGFTLMELMAVMVIIGILFGIIFTGASYLFSAQKDKKGKSRVEDHNSCTEQFKKLNMMISKCLSWLKLRKSEVRFFYVIIRLDGMERR